MIGLTRKSPQRRILIVLAGLLAVAATNVVSAHGGPEQGRYSNRNLVWRQCDVPRARPVVTRQSLRGLVAGRRAGSEAGYAAGRCNGWYKPSPKIRLKGHSRSYRSGYAIGYAEAYARGYRLAKRNQRKWRRVSRWW